MRYENEDGRNKSDVGGSSESFLKAPRVTRQVYAETSIIPLTCFIASWANSAVPVLRFYGFTHSFLPSSFPSCHPAITFPSLYLRLYLTPRVQALAAIQRESSARHGKSNCSDRPPSFAFNPLRCLRTVRAGSFSAVAAREHGKVKYLGAGHGPLCNRVGEPVERGGLSERAARNARRRNKEGFTEGAARRAADRAAAAENPEP